MSYPAPLKRTDSDENISLRTMMLHRELELQRDFSDLRSLIRNLHMTPLEDRGSEQLTLKEACQMTLSPPPPTPAGRLAIEDTA